MEETEEMLHLCCRVRDYLKNREYAKCEEEISYAMYLHPDFPEPHNLLGILSEHKHDHCRAMKHFRAAYALDPTYQPARDNLMDFAGFEGRHKSRFTVADCR